MKHILLLIIASLLVACSGDVKTSDSVTLEIVNKQLFFNIKKSDDGFGKSNIEYYSDVERNSAQNIITWKITNNSDKNYLFIINEDDLLRDPYDDNVMAHVRITDKQNKERSGGMSAISWTMTAGRFSECEISNDSVSKLQDSLRGWKHFRSNKNFRKNSLVLHAGESHTFKSVISLPILQEPNASTLQNNISVFGLTDEDMLSIIYNWDAKEIESHLEKYQLDELKYNNTTIYNGTLESNRIPLKGR